jgi:hypothetical protein
MSRQRARQWPDMHKVAERYGVDPASEEAGERAYLVARDLGIANDMRTWDEYRGSQEYGGSTWSTYCPGLSPDEKMRWRLIAAAGGGA